MQVHARIPTIREGQHFLFLAIGSFPFGVFLYFWTLYAVRAQRYKAIQVNPLSIYILAYILSRGDSAKTRAEFFGDFIEHFCHVIG